VVNGRGLLVDKRISLVEGGFTWVYWRGLLVEVNIVLLEGRNILVLGIGLLVEGRGVLVKRRGISGRRRKGVHTGRQEIVLMYILVRDIQKCRGECTLRGDRGEGHSVGRGLLEEKRGLLAERRGLLIKGRSELVKGEYNTGW
jgi:hypothetical protein